MPEFVAEIRHPNAYARMISAFRDRAEQRRIAICGNDVAAVAGLPSCYIGKLLSPAAQPMRRVGMISLGPLLAVLGLKIILAEDPEALEQFGARIPAKDDSATRMLAVKAGRGKQQLVSVRFLRKIAHSGGVARNLALSPARRKKIARKAALAKWAKARGGEAEAAARAPAQAEAA
jgi:hypothetical protein